MNTFLGLGIVDWIVLVGYAIGMFAIALWARRRIRTTSDFYQGNRSFGRVLIAFLNFGNMTDAGQTAGVAREVYRQGLSGVWFQNLVLFHTPFQWFTAALQRRARYIGPADLYLHRFQSRFLAGLYASVVVVVALYANAQGYLLTGKTLEAMLVKPAVEYTAEERRSVEGFRSFKELSAIPAASRTPLQQRQFEELKSLEAAGGLRSFVSYVDLKTFYVAYALIIMAYTVIGGLFAIAVIDIIQGILIVFLSLALIPVALERIGGLSGLQEKVPAHQFDLFGASATSDYTWYFVASLALLNLVVNAPKSFTLGGAGRDDRAARIGFVTGAMSKRLMMIAWAFTGLLAVGLYQGQVADPTNIWGFMTRDLLGAGALGLMIAAIFSANMDGNSTISLDASAAVVKNILLPLRPGTTERAQMIVGRGVILVLLSVAVFLADQLDDIFIVFKYILSVGTIVGPSFWLAYFWRRLTTTGVVIQMSMSIMMTVVVPNVVPLTPWAESPALTQQTAPRTVEMESRASAADVSAGLADSVGQTIRRSQTLPANPIYFERIAQTARGTVRGEGLFRPQVWIMDQIGMDFSDRSRAEIMTTAALFDATIPFVILIVASLMTRRNSEWVLRDFYARIHTPAVADPTLDARLVSQKIDDPTLVERDKIFPGTDWEFWKPTRFDVIGFVGCIAFVGLIVFFYSMVASIASP